jgi:hypothetical protein
MRCAAGSEELPPSRNVCTSVSSEYFAMNDEPLSTVAARPFTETKQDFAPELSKSCTTPEPIAPLEWS